VSTTQDTYTVLLVGGPCDRRYVALKAAALSAGKATCKGAEYLYAPDTHDPWIFQYAPDKAAGKPVGDIFGANTIQSGERQVYAAWSRLMHSLAFYVPAQEARTRAAITRIRKAVR
jgi:hypothetical protein